MYPSRCSRPRRIGLFTTIGLATLAVAAVAHATPTWVPLETGSPPGSPPSVTFDTGASNQQQSFFDISIPGFWSEEATDTSGTVVHERIMMPEYGTTLERGAPKLPVIRLRLAIVTDASALSVISYSASATQTLGGYYPWPDSEPQQDHAEGKPEGYTRDDRIYSDNAFWPATDYEFPGGAPGSLLGSIKGATIEIHPFKSNPVTQELQVATQLRIGVAHPGTVGPQRLLTKERIRLAANLFDNWPSVSNDLAANEFKFEAEYLVIYPSEVDSILQPLVNLKKIRGYKVTELPIQPTWNTCNDFRGEILSWYNGSDPDKDHYCLLVGDISEIPNCISPGLMTEAYPLGIPTDDLYGSIDGNDLNEEVFVGRISYDDSTDLRDQIEKIVYYQTVNLVDADYDEVLLVAHREDAPEKYQAAHESVRTAFYVKPPNFQTHYGGEGAGDSGVRWDINHKCGLVAYRGHGSSTEWTDWSWGHDFFEQADIDQLYNGPYTPVIWSFACKTGNIETSDCLGEQFMAEEDDGAVAFYGSTRNSYTDENHELDRQMFQAVYTVGLTTISHAIQFGEMMMTDIVDFHNAWMYLLLGDPDMEIRTGPPTIWDIVAPPAIPPCNDGCPPVDITILDDQGQPLEGVLVAAWKEGLVPTKPNSPALMVDEMLDNRYTNAAGQVQIPVSSLSEGTLFYTVQDEFGNSVLDSIHVGSLVGAPVPTPAIVSLRATPTVFRGETLLDFGAALPRDGRLVIYDAAGRLVTRMKLTRGEQGVSWKATDRAGSRVGAGVYFAKLIAGEIRRSTRLVVLP